MLLVRPPPVVRQIIHRLLFTLVILFGVVAIIFSVIRLAPGDPATAVLGPFASPEARAEFTELRGLNDPAPIRFLRFLGDLAGGDLGVSITQAVPVTELLARHALPTLQLTVLAVAFAVVVSLGFGLLSARRRDTPLDAALRGFTAFGLAAPDFWIGLIAIQVIALGLAWLPPGGYVPISEGGFAWFESMVLPSIVLGLPLAAAFTGVLRAALVEELEKDYVRTALGTGLRMGPVLRKHVLRNALVDPLTVFGIRLGYLLSGAVVIETLFDIPGLGALMLTAVNQGDLAVIQGVALVGTLGFVMSNLLVDILYYAINPKLKV